MAGPGFADHYRDDAPRLAVFAMALGADHDRAAQLAHESLIVLWRRWDGPARMRPDVCSRDPRSRRRRAGTRPMRPPAHCILDGDEHHAFLGALAALPDRQWAVLAATFDDLTPDAVAQVLDIGRGQRRPDQDAGPQRVAGGSSGARSARPAYEAWSPP